MDDLTFINPWIFLLIAALSIIVLEAILFLLNWTLEWLNERPRTPSSWNPVYAWRAWRRKRKPAMFTAAPATRRPLYRSFSHDSELREE